MKKILLFIIAGVLAIIFIGLVTAFFLLGPIHSEAFSATVELPPPDAGFVLISPDFSNGSSIPQRFTCAGENIPPTLAWGEPPAGTKSYLLMVEDPDAQGAPWTHWIVYNLPAETRSLDAQTRPGMQIDDVTILFGINSWGGQSYRGPCPPSGVHHYVFRLSALDIMLGPEDNSSKNELESVMHGHILGSAEIIGTYSK
jgi:Raf kinase inhibitor-like YbhB/YbcL family protein